MMPLTFTVSKLAHLSKYSKIYVGLSGGMDSVVLLHVLMQQSHLREKIIALHVNHRLSPHAVRWQKFCKDMCHQWQVSFITEALGVIPRCNLEAHARAARYQVFKNYASSNDVVVLGHHRADQIETLLYQLLRGSGMGGLSAMPEEHSAHGFCLYRPFLTISKEQLQAYARQWQLTWVEDESNHCLEFDRNFLRHDIIPKLKQRWPELEHTLSRVTQHASEAQQNLYELALLDYPDLVHAPLQLPYGTLHLSARRLSNVVWWWLKTQSIRNLNQTLMRRVMNEMVGARQPSGQSLPWGGGTLHHHQRVLVWLPNQSALFQNLQHFKIDWHHFPKPLVLPQGLGMLRPQPSKHGLLLPQCAEIAVRWRQGGERFTWHGQTKILKKLLQAWSIPAWERASIPLLYVDQHLAAVADYAISDACWTKDPGGYQIFWERE